MLRCLALSSLLFPGLAAADVTGRFIEGAPKDTFVIEGSTCTDAPVQIAIDLTTAPAGLIFDVTADGAGVEVFQPVELVSGAAQIASVTDGDQILELLVTDLMSVGPLRISADIDDTLTNGDAGQIIVRGGEIAGATLRIKADGAETQAAFDTAGLAQITLPDCIG